MTQDAQTDKHSAPMTAERIEAFCSEWDIPAAEREQWMVEENEVIQFLRSVGLSALVSSTAKPVEPVAHVCDPTDENFDDMRCGFLRFTGRALPSGTALYSATPSAMALRRQSDVHSPMNQHPPQHGASSDGR